MDQLIIMRSAIIVPRTIIAQFDLQSFEKSLRMFRIKYKPRIGGEKELKLYKVSEQFYIFPKASLPLLIKSKLIHPDISVSFSKQIPDQSNTKLRVLAQSLSLFPNQDLVVKYLTRTVYSDARVFGKISGCVLIAPPGDGKTRIALAVAAHRGFNTLFIVANEFLMKQADDEIRAMFGNAVKVTYVGGKLGKGKRDNTGDIVIAIINSIIGCKPEFFEPFGFTIIDEAHDYCSPEFSNVYWRSQSVCTLAMTASPEERTDRFDRSLPIHVGPYVYATELPGYSPDEVKFACEVMVIRYNGPAEHTRVLMNEKLGIVSPDLMIKQVHRDPYRLALLANIILNLYNSGRNMYVFVEQKIYGYMIQMAIHQLQRNILNENIVDTDKDFHIIIGGSSSEDIARAKQPVNRGDNGRGGNGGDRGDIARGCVIITTYSYSRKGISIPKMDTLIFATPRRTGMTQICGRIFRRGGDPNIKRIIIDLVDNACSLKSRFSDRNKHYTARGWEISSCIRKYADIVPIEVAVNTVVDDEVEVPDGLDVDE